MKDDKINQEEFNEKINDIEEITADKYCTFSPDLKSIMKRVYFKKGDINNKDE